jgi:hypothetical protein
MSGEKPLHLFLGFKNVNLKGASTGAKLPATWSFLAQKL